MSVLTTADAIILRAARRTILDGVEALEMSAGTPEPIASIVTQTAARVREELFALGDAILKAEAARGARVGVLPPVTIVEAK